MGTRYNTGKHSWKYGEQLNGGTWHIKLGPCPKCGYPTFDYGGGWRCLNLDCFNSENNPISSLGPRPEWWNTDIVVRMDGNAWHAYKKGFKNLQESISGFGETPKDAVINLKNNRTKE